jgi:hypothetical protein
MASPRTPETVTSEIERERDRLVQAVSNLRTDLRAATSVRTILRTKWPLIVGAAAVGGGVLAAVLLLRGRHPEPAVLARIGRLAIIQQDD